MSLLRLTDRLPSGRRSRSPAVPHAASLAFVYAGVSAFAAHNLHFGGAVDFAQACLWGLSTSLALGAAFLALPLLRFLERRGSFASTGWKAWGLFYLILGLGALLAGLLRSWTAPWILGGTLAPERFWGLALNLATSAFFVTVCLEVTMARARARDRWSAEQERLRSDLERLTFDLITTDDSLRQETAEYLHGEMQTRLLVAWAHLDQARSLSDPAEAAHLIAKAEALLAHLRSQSMRQAKDLLGVDVDPASLIPTLDALAERFEELLPVQVEILPSARMLQARVPLALLRAALPLVEEALLNAFRHARASMARVTLGAGDAASLLLSVQDDGVGFDPAVAPRNLGLAGLGQAIEGLGGAWEVQSRPGEGTRLVIRLPVAESEAVPR